MSKRKLTRDELKASEIGLKIRENELKNINTALEIIDFKLNVEINYNFQKEIERWKKMKKDNLSEKNNIENIIKILKDQMENGVEIKEAK